MCHGRTQSVGLVAVEPCADPCQFHQLLLKNGNTQCLAQHRFGQWMRKTDLLLPVPSSQVRVNRLPLDWPRPDESHLNGQVVERLWLHLRQRRHLCSRFDLKDTNRVGFGEHPIHSRFLGNRGQVEGGSVCFLDHVDGEVQCIEHAQSEQVELDYADRCAIVLIPLDYRPVFHPTPFDRHHLPERAIGNDHSAGMNTEVTWKSIHTVANVIHELRRHAFGQRCLESQLRWIPRIDIFGQAVDLSLRESKRLPDVTQHRPGPIGYDIRNHRRPLAPIAAIAILDHFFTPIGFEIEVDIGRPPALFGEEPLEREPETYWIDSRQTQAAAHRRIGSRPANLAIDLLSPGELHQVPYDKEVTGKVELADHFQFMFEAFHCSGVYPACTIRVHLPSTVKGQLPQILHLGSKVPGHRKVGQLWSHQVEVESQ